MDYQNNGNKGYDILINIILDDLQHQVPNKLLKHIIGVRDMAAIMSEKFGVNINKAIVAALLHDYAKLMIDDELLQYANHHNMCIDEVCEKSPFLLHGPVAADIAQEKYNITDEDILNAICYHTYGRENMSDLEKIIYVADAIEMGRDYPDVDKIREIALKDLNKGLTLVVTRTLHYIIERGRLIHPNTVVLWNSCIGK